MEDLKMIFANNLKYYMQLNNKTSHELNHDLVLSFKSLDRWLDGSNLPKPKQISLLAEYFNIKSEDFFIIHDAIKVPNKVATAKEVSDLYLNNIPLKTCINKIIHLNKKQLEVLLDVLDDLENEVIL